MNEVIQEIIDELNMIPKSIKTDLNIKEITDVVSKELQRRGNRSFS